MISSKENSHLFSLTHLSRQKYYKGFGRQNSRPVTFTRRVKTWTEITPRSFFSHHFSFQFTERLFKSKSLLKKKPLFISDSLYNKRDVILEKHSVLL